MLKEVLLLDTVATENSLLTDGEQSYSALIFGAYSVNNTPIFGDQIDFNISDISLMHVRHVFE
jgi:hypothetical protein